MRTTRILSALFPVLLVTFTACLPYTVGSTARTVPTDETKVSSSYYFIPNAVRHTGDTVGFSLPGLDVEVRYGLDARSDAGVRILPFGVAVDYKHRIDGDRNGTGTALAYMVGGGVVNGGSHVMLQGTLIASAREDVAVSQYGGLRIMHVMPTSQFAVTDHPTVGGFAGVQLGTANFTVRPELGIFHDHSALGLRSRDVIFVPAITIQRRTRRTFEVKAPGLGLPKGRTPGQDDPRRGCGPVPCDAPGAARRPGRTKVP